MLRCINEHVVGVDEMRCAGVCISYVGIIVML